MLVLYYRFRWTYIPIGGYWVKKIITNHARHFVTDLFLLCGEFIIPQKSVSDKFKRIIGGIFLTLLIIGIAFVYLNLRSCFNRFQDKNYDVFSPTMTVKKPAEPTTDTKKEPPKEPVVKRPFFGVGKKATGGVIIEDTSKHAQGGKPVDIEVWGEDFKVYVPPTAPAKITIVRPPIISIGFSIWGGAMATYYDQKIHWGLLVKCQPIKVYKFGVSGFASNRGYGLGLGYLPRKNISLDILYNFYDKRAWLGIGAKL